MIMLGGLLASGCAVGHAQSPAPAKLEELRQHNEGLRQRLADLVAGDPVLAGTRQIAEPVVVGIRTKLIERVIQEVGFHYLDKIELDLAPNVHINHTQELAKKTFLGKVKGGTLSVNINILNIKAMILARPPAVEFAGANRVSLRVPVRVDKGEGAAEFHFTWDSAGLANLVCKDFEFHDRLRGTILPASYSVAGHFVLSATSRAVVASPRFADQKFRLRLDLTPESWAKVQRAIEAQDSFGKCGVAIDPSKIMEKLRGLGQKGFEVRIPRSLVRPVNLPASVEEQLNVQDHAVALSVKPGVLGLDKDALVFSSSVSTSLAAMAIPPQGRKPAGSGAN